MVYKKYKKIIELIENNIYVYILSFLIINLLTFYIIENVNTRGLGIIWAIYLFLFFYPLTLVYFIISVILILKKRQKLKIISFIILAFIIIYYGYNIIRIIFIM